MALLEIENLTVCFPTATGLFTAVENVSLSVGAGEILGIVGESGAGKSTVGNAIIGLLDYPGYISEGAINLQGQNLADISAEELRKVRGRRVSVIFQDPLTALNPVRRIGQQLIETIQLHLDLDDEAVRERAIELLDQVGIPEPETRLRQYPHELSGGLRQRVVIAIALSGEPEVIIADEPTTALDVSIQAQILGLIQSICRERGVGVILITHDMGVIAEVADRVAVMYYGRLVEIGKTSQIINQPQQPYTQRLISAVPRTDRKLGRFTLLTDSGPKHKSAEGGGITRGTAWFKARTGKAPSAETLVSVRNLSLDFLTRKAILGRNREYLHAVQDVSFEIKNGEVFGLVGESGSGKSTVAKLIAGLHEPKSGSIAFDGVEFDSLANERDRRNYRLQMQMIFQDPFSSLNPRMRVGDIIAEPMLVHKAADRRDVTQIVEELLERVGMDPSDRRRMPHQFSGGQRQRICIARALATRPRFLICDEPTSALDVSIQAQILNLLKDLQTDLSLTILFISHDLAVIRQMCDRVAVMRHGQLCELNDCDTLFEHPRHEYTKELLRLMPKFSRPPDAA